MQQISDETKAKIGKKIGEGAFADVHEFDHGGVDFVVKIGQTTSWAPPISGNFKVNFPRAKISRLLEVLLGDKFKIQPDEQFVVKGLAEHELLHRYFGSEDKPNDEVHRLREHILQDLQNSKSAFYKSLFGDNGRYAIVCSEVFAKHKKESFLPAEHIQVGTPLSDGAPLTYYLFQRAVRGEHVLPLYKFSKQQYTEFPLLTERLLTFSVLVKRMYFDTETFIDSRPHEVGKHFYDWFQKTSNILLDTREQKVYFIDTRWLWDTGDSTFLGKTYIKLMHILSNRSLSKAIYTYARALKQGTR
ncbi:MAG TPA: hypothetical protein VEA59_02205 [Patescibacteria group bacterium]|nr:hypothetical protein [Patescibacteria group bacterium]